MDYKKYIIENPIYIAQGLNNAWARQRAADKGDSIPLINYLEFNYNERYVKLCYRLGVEPVSFAKWLLKPIKSVI